MRYKKLKIFLCLAAMLIIILDSRCAISGAVEGLNICLYTVIPALFPYSVLSLLFQTLIAGQDIKHLSPIEKLLKIPQRSGVIFLLGILGGYPTGAICTKKSGINRNTAETMTVFCNNAGPSFIFGIVSMIFPKFTTLLLIWFIQVTSAIITGILLNKNADTCSYIIAPQRNSNVIQEAIAAMVKVCSTIILFRVLLSCVKMHLNPLWGQEIFTLILGVLELTNGIIDLNQIPSESLRFIVCCSLLSFGGICVAIQTLFIATNIRLGKYLLGKLLHAIISGTLAAMTLYSPILILVVPIVSILIIVNISSKGKKAVAFFS